MRRPAGDDSVTSHGESRFMKGSQEDQRRKDYPARIACRHTWWSTHQLHPHAVKLVLTQQRLNFGTATITRPMSRLRVMSQD
jgi:hypothetical protein